MCTLHYQRSYRTGDPTKTPRMLQVDRENATGVRVCTQCAEGKPLDEFRRHSRSLNGHLRECKACFSTRVKSWYLESGKHQVRTTSRRNHLLRNYGLTADQFNEMLDKQDGRCAVCGEPGKRLFVDHDHATGDVRSLLCHHCNLALGFAGDSVETLQRLITYLQEHALGR